MSQATAALGNTSADISKNYLTLLVTQLQNQNPLDPMDTKDMASQLSSLAQLSQVEDINSKFDQVLQLSQMGQGAGLIGKQVTFVPDGADAPVTAEVGGVQVTSEKVYVFAGGHQLGLDEIQAIQ